MKYIAIFGYKDLSYAPSHKAKPPIMPFLHLQ